MNTDLRDRLLALAAHDLAVRDELAANGSLFDGYHPAMRAVHEENAAQLREILATSGWPAADQVGSDGAQAAWLIAQHAIGLPQVQRACLRALHAAVARRQIPAWQPAMLLDRIRTMEGKPQLFGTQFDWDDAGELSPLPIADAVTVDARRAGIGLPPMAEAIADQRARLGNERPPPDPEQRRLAAEEWAKRAGWR